MSSAGLLKRAALCAALATALAMALMFAADAPCALALSPWWHLFSGSRPATLRRGRAQPGRPDGQLVVTLANLGDAAVNGEGGNPVRITDRLPAGLRATSVLKISGKSEEVDGEVQCALEQSATVVACTFAHQLPSYEQIELVIGVIVEAETPGVENKLAVSGGGAPPATISRLLAFGGEPAFGVEDYEAATEEAGGAADTQAGSHPFQTTFSLTLDQSLAANVGGELGGEEEPFVRQLPKDVDVELPPGLVGNPTAVPRCPLPEFLAKTPSCSPRTIVGVAMVTINEAARGLPLSTVTTPVFNLEPLEGLPGHPLTGEPARFGFSVAEVPVFLDTTLRASGDYGVTTEVQNITQTSAFLSNKVIIWGVPGDASHDATRGVACLEAGVECNGEAEANPPPFFSLPTSCSGRPLNSDVLVDSWAHPGAFTRFAPSTPLPTLDGCGLLPFSGGVAVEPEGTAGSTPTGLKADVHVPQEDGSNADGLMPADVKDITVALPEGLALNPSAADGLQACSETQVGYEGEAEPAPGAGFPGKVKVFNERPKDPETEEPGTNACPDASKIGTAKIETPLLPKPLQGGVYLATPAPNGEPGMNPFNSLVAMYIVAEDPHSGARVKLAGEVHLSETGQIVTTFEDNPQLPFEDAEVRFFGGERAPLGTPARCAAYTTSATLAPWSDSTPLGALSSFPITSGPGGAACPGASLPFTTALTGGATNSQAGSFSPLTATIDREDGSQGLRSLQLRFPPGLSAMLSGVKLCPEAQANAGTCSSESEIGEATVSVGLGGDPYAVKGARIYVTESYRGASFGLSVVTPAVAGPFNLGNVVVRAKVEVDPRTAALTVTTNSPAEGYAIPQILDGIPLQIRHVNAIVTRPHFTFNPTNCSQLAITSLLAGVEGASAETSVPFTVANCASLKFGPTIQVATPAHASRANGAALHFRIAYPKGATGSESWLREVKVDLPKQLSTRLPTLQQACLQNVFESNAAACPPAAKIGTALVHTPVLPVPLEGPVYFVSYGGAKFPEAVIVLRGYGVTIELHGETFISRKNITSATFRNTPDVPFESVEVTLPQGRYSEFAANLPHAAQDFCGQHLIMPTRMVAQNGLEIRQNTKIAVTGCPKPKQPKRARRARRRREG